MNKTNKIVCPECYPFSVDWVISPCPTCGAVQPTLKKVDVKRDILKLMTKYGIKKENIVADYPTLKWLFLGDRK